MDWFNIDENTGVVSVAQDLRTDAAKTITNQVGGQGSSIFRLRMFATTLRP